MAKAVVASNERSEAGERRESAPQRFKQFLNDVRNEMRKVWYPSQKEVQATTAVVIVTVFLFALYFWVVDTVLGRGIDQILNWARK